MPAPQMHGSQVLNMGTAYVSSTSPQACSFLGAPEPRGGLRMTRFAQNCCLARQEHRMVHITQRALFEML